MPSRNSGPVFRRDGHRNRRTVQVSLSRAGDPLSISLPKLHLRCADCGEDPTPPDPSPSSLPYRVEFVVHGDDSIKNTLQDSSNFYKLPHPRQTARRNQMPKR